MKEETTTVQIYRTDRPLLDEHGKPAAEAVRKLLTPCKHESKKRVGGTVVTYPNQVESTSLKFGSGLTLPVTVYVCESCGEMIVLPGQAVETGDE